MRLARWLFWLSLLLCALACDGERPPATQTPARPVRATLRLVLITDLDGYLVPCGCQSRPLGGVDKAAALMRELRADGVPTVLLAAGNLFFAGDTGNLKGTAASEAATQEQWEAETLASALRKLELNAAAPGPADLRHGKEKLDALAKAGGVGLLGVGQSTLLLRRGGAVLGVFGVSDAGAAGADLVAEAQRLARELRSQGAEIVVGLVSAEARVARRLAGATKDVDFVLHGGVDAPAALAPERVVGASLLRASHRGQGLLVLDVFRAGTGPFADASAWTRTEHKRALQERISELAAKITDWEKQKDVDQTELATQRARLSALRTELSQLDAPAHASGNRFDARFVELDPDTPEDTDIRALLQAHDRRLNEHNRTALAHLKAPAGARGQPVYVGAQRCGDCHESELAWWKGHEHGRAYATLEKVHKQFSLSCVGCHVTGYNQPGGSAVVQNKGLTDVGCESCHGPGSLHVKDQDVDESVNVHLDTPESTCVQCHNAEHSDRFVYAEYRKKLLVPGHGLPDKASP